MPHRRVMSQANPPSEWSSEDCILHSGFPNSWLCHYPRLLTFWLLLKTPPAQRRESKCLQFTLTLLYKDLKMSISEESDCEWDTKRQGKSSNTLRWLGPGDVSRQGKEAGSRLFLLSQNVFRCWIRVSFQPQNILRRHMYYNLNFSHISVISFRILLARNYLFKKDYLVIGKSDITFF